MAKNWSAYEAAKEMYGNNVESIQDIGSRYPLFSRAIMQIDDDALLDILAAVPKITARVVETGLKAVSEGDVPEAEEEKKENTKKENTKEEADEPEEEESEDYESMTAQALYKLCCKRGLSGKCKQRNKKFLIGVLTEADKGTADEPEEEDDWDEEEDTPKDPYAGKGAKELYEMCKDRGIKTKPKMKAVEYVKLLKKADETEAEEPEDDDDDEWDI